MWLAFIFICPRGQRSLSRDYAWNVCERTFCRTAPPMKIQRVNTKVPVARGVRPFSINRGFEPLTQVTMYVTAAAEKIWGNFLATWWLTVPLLAIPLWVHIAQKKKLGTRKLNTAKGTGGHGRELALVYQRHFYNKHKIQLRPQTSPAAFIY